MNLAVLLGFFISCVMIGAALFVGGEAIAFLNLPSLLIVAGGTLGATLTQYSGWYVFKVLRKSMYPSPIFMTPALMVEEVVNFAYFARREGILALERHVSALDDYHLKKGFQLAVDGLDPESIANILDAEMENTAIRHERGAQVLDSMAAYAPALGMMGTVIGLVQMLRTMDDPSTIGPAMAIALITTFYGIVLANLLFSPLAGRLREHSQDELLLMRMGKEGILGIAEGENPRVLREKISAYLPITERTAKGKK